MTHAENVQNDTDFFSISIAVIQDYLTTQMDSVYKYMQNVAENHEELPDAAKDYSTLHTFWLVSAVVELIVDYSERIYDKVKSYSNRFHEFMSREWDVLFGRTKATTASQIMKSAVNQIEKEENDHLKNDVTLTINV